MDTIDIPPIRRATLAEIIALRHEVLRAGLPPESAIFPGDELPTSFHFGAFTRSEDGWRAVGCATFHLSQWESQPAWQLRGMATSADFRRRGLGRALLSHADIELGSAPQSPRSMWCNARAPAIGFYELLGWKVVSDVFDIPTAGPHVRMFRRL